MGFSNSLAATAIIGSIALVGCGGSGGDNASAGDTNAAALDNSPANSTPGQGTFFDPADGVSIASAMGEDIVSAFARSFDASVTPLGDSDEASASVDSAFEGSFSLNNADVFDNTEVFNDDNGSGNSTEQCDSGSVSTSVGFDNNDDLENASYVFNNCVTDGQTTNGSMSIAVSTSGSTENFNVQFISLETTGSEGNSLIDGGVNLGIEDDLSSSISGSSLSLTDNGETTVFSNFDFTETLDESAETSAISGQAVITSATDGTITYSINPAFSSSFSEDYPAFGTLSLTHADGSYIIIDADTGDLETFAYTVSGNGSVTTGVGRWDEQNIEEPRTRLRRIQQVKR